MYGSWTEYVVLWRYFLRFIRDVYFLSWRAKSTFKIILLGGYVVRIDFFKSLNMDDKKCQKKIYSKLIRCLDMFRYLSIEIFSINQSINYFFFIIKLNFLFFVSLFADTFKFFIYRLFNKNSSKSTENVCEQWDITETNNWIRLLVLMIIVDFYLLHLFLNNYLVYFRMFTTFFVFVIEQFLKNRFSKSSLKNEQMIPKIFFTILHSQFNSHTLPVTPFKRKIFRD